MALDLNQLKECAEGKAKLGYSEACEWAHYVLPIQNPGQNWEALREEIKPTLRNHHPVMDELKKLNADDSTLSDVIDYLAEDIVHDPLESVRWRLLAGIDKINKKDFAHADFARHTHLNFKDAVDAIDCLEKIAHPKSNAIREPNIRRRFRDEYTRLFGNVSSQQEVKDRIQKMELHDAIPNLSDDPAMGKKEISKKFGLSL